MKKSSKFLQVYFLSICLLCLVSCDDLVSLGYDEAIQGNILDKDVTKTPEENVRQLLSTVGVEAESITFFSKGGKRCGCNGGGGGCKCMLRDANGDTSHKCGAVESGDCTKEKYVVVEVLPENAEKVKGLGFAAMAE